MFEVRSSTINVGVLQLEGLKGPDVKPTHVMMVKIFQTKSLPSQSGPKPNGSLAVCSWMVTVSCTYTN